MNKNVKKFFNLAVLFLVLTTANAQEPTSYKLSLEQAIEMGIKNHQSLKISQAQVDASEQQVKVSKLQRLPTLTLSASAFYLGDATILDTDLSKVQTVELPHFGNTYGLQAAQVLYKGGVIQKSIELSELKQQLAELDMEKNEQEIKFLIISNYLDICKIINQTQVLEQNKVLAEQLHANISKLHEQDMVTRNELIRAELQIQNLDMSILSAQNNHAILSNQLSYAIGLSDNNVLIMPTDSVKNKAIAESQSHYTDLALKNPSMKVAEKNVEIADKNVSIQKSNWFPSLSAFGGYNMQRPITSTTPAVDMFNNSWQVGVNLNFNIDNLYKTKKQVNLSKSQKRVSEESLTYARQNVNIAVNSAYLKYQEAEQQVRLMDVSRALANENYEIVRNKYLNQLAITADMTDASNAKLNAELQYSNAVINAVFQYYNLLKSSGSL